MRVVKAVMIAIGCLAVLCGLVLAFYVVESRRAVQRNLAPATGIPTRSPAANVVLVSEPHGNSSFLVREATSTQPRARLTSAQSGFESEAGFSHDGKLVVYSYAISPTSTSAIWIVGADGSNPHALTGPDEDAVHPVFSPDDTTIFYAVSRWTGNHSPIAAPRRHEWDIFSRSVHAGSVAVPQQITNESFYDLRSLDAVSDGVRPGKIKLLLSTSAYPIGDLFEEIIPGAAEGKKIFQPHVPNASTVVGPSFGEARFAGDGMVIVFLAASDPPQGGNYDYNGYSMSDVTGSELKQLTHLTGMTTELHMLSPNKIAFINGGAFGTADLESQAK